MDTNVWSQVYELWWTLVFPVLQPSTRLLPLSCLLIFRQLWFAVIYHGGLSGTDKALPWNGKLLFVSVCECSGAHLPSMLQFSVLINRHCLDLYFSDQPRKKFFNTGYNLLCTICIHYTHVLMFSLSLSNHMGPSLPLASGNHWVFPHFFLSPHGHPCLIICRLFPIFIRQCKKQYWMQHAVKSQKATKEK